MGQDIQGARRTLRERGGVIMKENRPEAWWRRGPEGRNKEMWCRRKEEQTFRETCRMLQHEEEQKSSNILSA